MDNLIKDEQQLDYMLILEKMAGLYVSVHQIDLVKNTAKEINTNAIVNKYVKEGADAINMMRRVMEHTASDAHRERVLEFSDLTTIADRLKGKHSIFEEFIGKHLGWVKEGFILLEEDENGTPTKVLHTIEVIDEQKKKEENLMRISITDELTGLFNRKA